MTVRHPAVYSQSIQQAIRLALVRHELPVGSLVVDPFAGVGTIHELLCPTWRTWAIEIEPEWATQSVPRHYDATTIVGSCLEPMSWPAECDAVVVSPCYGNRMSDHHEAKDASKRNTYRHVIGRPLTDGTSATMQWGFDYRDFHQKAWGMAVGRLRPGGLFVLNISDHIRKGKRQPVEGWHLATLTELGLVVEEAQRIETRRQRFGKNGALRVDGELLAVLRKGNT